MALQNEFRLTLNVKDEKHKFVPTVTANDHTVFLIDVKNGTEPVELLDTYRYVFVVKAPGKDSVMREATLNEDELVVVELGYSETRYPGLIDCALQIYDENDKRISTMRMQANVKGDMAIMGGLPAEDSTLIMADEALLTKAVSVVDEIEQARGTEPTIGARINYVAEQLGGTVKQVNGVTPDPNGNVVIDTSSLATKPEVASLENQLNQLVIAGDSSIEAAQARVGGDGTVYTTLKERLDAKDDAFAENVTNVPFLVDEVKTPLSVTWQENKFTYSATGQVQDGAGWATFNANKPNNVSGITIGHPTTGAVRLIQYGENKAFISSATATTNTLFTFNENCRSFAINIVIGDSPDPASNLGSKFSLTGFSALLSGTQYENKSLKEKIEELNGEISEAALVSEGKEEVQIEIRLNQYRTGAIFSPGTDWATFYIPRPENVDKIILQHDDETDVRFWQYGSNGSALSGVNNTAKTNTVLQLAEACTHIAVNFIIGPAPNPSQPWKAIDPGKLKLYAFVKQYETKSLIDHIATLKSDLLKIEEKKPSEHLKVLFVGNSFAQDPTWHLHRIAASAGIDMTVGLLIVGGSSLEDHWTRIQGNLGVYTNYKLISSNGVATSTTHNQASTFDNGLDGDSWDIVVFQQASPNSGRYTTFQPYLNDLITYVKSKAKNPSVKFALHQTWAYASDSTNSGFSNYNSNQMEMYEAIMGAYQQAMQETDIDILLPSGTAIQNARTNSYLSAIGRDLTTDGMHLEVLGGYISALTMFETLVAKKNGIDIFSDVTHLPTGGTRFLVYLAKTAAVNARINPFKVTEI